VELVEDERPERDLHHVREIRMEAVPPQGNDAPTASVLLFMQEILLRTLKEESADPHLFGFVHHQLEHLALHGAGPMTTIHFLLGLSHHLGFHPSPPRTGEENFDLMEGCFVRGDAPSGHTLRPPLSTALAEAIRDPDGAGPPGGVRHALLDHLLLYFRLHVAGFGEPRSLEVLRQVLA
jgi:DNA repair protein RecO (recombination protein O)